MSSLRKYTPEQIKQVQQLTNKGVPDKDISEITKVNRTKVKTITTQYWKDKMKNKKQ